MDSRLRGNDELIRASLSEQDEKRLRQITGKSGRAAVVAVLNGALRNGKHASKTKRRATAQPARGAKRFTSARDAIAYLEREAGI